MNNQQPDNIRSFPASPPKPPPSNDNGRGVGLGLVLCGLALLLFPHVTGMTAWAIWVFYIAGLLLLLVGILGWCIERGKR